MQEAEHALEYALQYYVRTPNFGTTINQYQALRHVSDLYCGIMELCLENYNYIVRGS